MFNHRKLEKIINEMGRCVYELYTFELYKKYPIT